MLELITPPRRPAEAVNRALLPVGAVLNGPLAGFTNAMRATVTDRVTNTMGNRVGLPGVQYTDPVGDPGLFGPDSVTWRVFADFPCMFMGGISSLFLQALHPGVMAGVADHSDYRSDPQARLARTGSFVAGTAYGSTEVAERLIGTVRALHNKVVGTRPDGIPYEANDPDHLAWVHVTEVGQFLRSYQRYSGRALSPADVDQYYAETSIIGRELGGTNIPMSAVEVRDFYRRMRPELAVFDQARDTIAWLLDPPGAKGAEAAVYQVMVAAAIGLMPRWAHPVAELAFDPIRHGAVVEPTAALVANALRWSMGVSPVVAEARARVGVAA